MKNSDKREEVIKAALELIAEHGFHGAPMAKVADRAGVGAGTIYRYFESKDAMIAGIFNELEKKVVESLMQGYSVDRPLRQRFIHLATMIIRYFIANAIHFRFIEQYMNSPYGVSRRRERLLGKARDIDLFRHLLQEGIDRQALKDLPLTLHFALDARWKKAPSFCAKRRAMAKPISELPPKIKRTMADLRRLDSQSS